MKSRIIKIKDAIVRSDESIFYFISILFAVMFCFIAIGGDDPGNGAQKRTIIENLRSSLDSYQTWSSRLFIGFVAGLLFDHLSVLLPIYVGVSMFVLLKALSLLFVDHHFKECNCFIGCLVMLYPFQQLSTAGWVSTMATYFGPVAFGFLALVPIKKIYSDRKFTTWEYILYALSLIYGANVEQMMIVILISYLVAFVYFLYHKKHYVYCCLLLALSIGSCLLIILCPGNYNRKGLETARQFPTYGMLNGIDKADIGMFTTLKWLLFDSNLFVICICLLMTILIWKKYNDGLLRALSMLPVFITVCLGPLRGVLTVMYPFITSLTEEISYYGLVTTENRGDALALGRYAVMGITIAVICLEVFMLLQNYEELIVAVILLAAGTASRVAMGFSPTIYASNTRTFAVMGFSVIAVGVLIYAKNVEKGILSEIVEKKILYGMRLGLLFSFINLWFLISTIFRG